MSNSIMPDTDSDVVARIAVAHIVAANESKSVSRRLDDYLRNFDKVYKSLSKTIDDVREGRFETD